MTDAIEDWPWELKGVPPIETKISGDGQQRVRFCRRPEGTVQFFSQKLTRCETDGQEYFVWYHSPISGHYSTLEDAEKDATKIVPWLRPLDF